MLIVLISATFMVYQNVMAVGRVFDGPFSSDDSFDEQVPFDEYTRFTITCKDNNTNAFEMHLIMQDRMEARTAITDSERLWEDGIVPYSISKKFDRPRKNKIRVAINEFHEKTCVLFVPHSNEKQYLIIGPGKGCSSNIGKFPGGESQTRLRNECFFKPGTLIHELMHVIGFVHEHNRPDRDNFVKIIEENIQEGYQSQFEKYTWEEVQNFNYSYDYGSVMHYGAHFFSKSRNKSTIVPLQKGVEIGQRRGFSETDLLKINALYKCRDQQLSSDGIPDFSDEEYIS